jgi:hypothetical protein
LRHRPPLAPAEAVAVELDLEAVAEADEGIARQALAAFDAFQEEAGLERGELHERRDRRVEVARDVKVRLHAVILPQNAWTTKNPSPGSPEMGSGAVESIESRNSRRHTLSVRSGATTRA